MEKILEDLYIKIKRSFYSFGSVPALSVIIWLGLCGIFNIDGWWILYSFILVFIVTLVVWLVIKGRILPSAEKDKVGIIISIETDTEKQHRKVKKDISEEIKKLLFENNLQDEIDVVIIPRLHTEYVNRVLNSSGKKNQKRQYTNLVKDLNGKFFIMGSMRERMDEENHYQFLPNIQVVHSKVEETIKKQLQEDMSLSMPIEFFFPERTEITGFKFTSELIFLSTRYVLGIAAYISGDPALALKLHESILSDNLGNHEPQKTIKQRTELLVVSELYFLAIKAFEEEKFSESAEYATRAVSIFPTAWAFLILSNVAFIGDKNVYKSIKLLKSFKKHAGGREEVLYYYNLGFLYMFEGEYSKALRQYKNIFKRKDMGLPAEIDQILVFLDKYYIDNPDFHEALFISGLIEFRINKNSPMADVHLEMFLQRVKRTDEMKPLIKRSEDYLRRIKKQIGYGVSKE